MALLNLLLTAVLFVLGLFEGSGTGGDPATSSSDTDGGGDGAEGDGAEGGEAGKQEPDYKAETAKWKALARKHENQAKANADAARRLKEAEDADKSELQKATDRAQSAERERDETRGQLLRLEIAAEKGLTPAQAKRLIGATREELEADADELLEAFTARGGEGESRAQKPREGLRSRSVPGSEPEENDPLKLAAKVPR